MSLSRKRRKELRKLRGKAEDLWRDQQEVMDRANSLAREARRQAGNYAGEHVVPRVREGYEQYVQPGVDRGSKFLKRAGEKVADAVVPAVGSAIGTAMSVVDVAKDARVKAAIKRGDPKLLLEKKGPGFGTYLAIGAGVAVLAGVGYAVWQTFRADDELWVADLDADGPLEETGSPTSSAG